MGSFTVLIVAVSVVVPLLIIGLVVFMTVRLRKSFGGPTVIDMRTGTTTTFHDDGSGTTVSVNGQTYQVPNMTMTGGQLLGFGVPAVVVPAAMTGQGAMAQLSAQQRLGPVLAHDPDLRAETVYAEAERIFHKFQDCWTKVDPASMRGELDDGIWSAYREQLDTYRTEHKRCRLDGLHLEAMDILGAKHTDKLDAITIRVTWTCGDYDVDEQSGEIVRGDTDKRRYVQDWTFTRSGTATSVPRDRTNSCNQCGGPLEHRQRGNCPYCGAAIVGGDDHWILAGIYRQSEEKV